MLLIGVLVFVFYLFQTPPLLFNPAHERAVRDAQPAAYAALERATRGARRRAAPRAARRRRRGGESAARRSSAREPRSTPCAPKRSALAQRVTGQPSRDVNYIIPRFVLDHLPLGLAGHLHRGGHRGGDVAHRGRAQLAVDDDA